MEWQAIPSGCAHILEGHIRLGPVDVLHRTIHPHKTAHQALLRALSLQVLNERQQGAFTGIQRHHIDKIKQAGLAELPQLGVGIAAAQRNANLRCLRFDGLGDTQRGVHGAGKRHRQHHQAGLVCFKGLQGAMFQQVV